MRRAPLVDDLLVLVLEEVALLLLPGENHCADLAHGARLLLGRVRRVPLGEAHLALATDEEHKVDHGSHARPAGERATRTGPASPAKRKHPSKRHRQSTCGQRGSDKEGVHCTSVAHQRKRDLITRVSLQPDCRELAHLDLDRPRGAAQCRHDLDDIPLPVNTTFSPDASSFAS